MCLSYEWWWFSSGRTTSVIVVSNQILNLMWSWLNYAGTMKGRRYCEGEWGRPFKDTVLREIVRKIARVQTELGGCKFIVVFGWEIGVLNCRAKMNLSWQKFFWESWSALNWKRFFGYGNWKSAIASVVASNKVYGRKSYYRDTSAMITDVSVWESAY